jgi:ABC-type dipeptide/oligopeptide/nickel transport system permease component
MPVIPPWVLVTLIAVLMNLLVDLAYAALDPKIRYA